MSLAIPIPTLRPGRCQGLFRCQPPFDAGFGQGGQPSCDDRSVGRISTRHRARAPQGAASHSPGGVPAGSERFLGRQPAHAAGTTGPSILAGDGSIIVGWSKQGLRTCGPWTGLSWRRSSRKPAVTIRPGGGVTARGCRSEIATSTFRAQGGVQHDQGRSAPLRGP